MVTLHPFQESTSLWGTIEVLDKDLIFYLYLKDKQEVHIFNEE